MADKKKYVDELGHDLWQTLADGKLPEAEALAQQALSRPITHEEFYHLLGRYPSLHIRDIKGAKPTKGRKPEITKAHNGWTIHDYGDEILTTPGRLVYGGYVSSDEDDEEGGGGASLAVETLVHLSVNPFYYGVFGGAGCDGVA